MENQYKILSLCLFVLNLYEPFIDNVYNYWVSYNTPWLYKILKISVSVSATCDVISQLGMLKISPWQKMVVTKNQNSGQTRTWRLIGIFICFGKHYLKMLITMCLECRFGDNTCIIYEFDVLELYEKSLLFIWFSPFKKNILVNNILNNFYKFRDF